MENKRTVTIQYAKTYNGGYSTTDGKWVHGIKITGHTVPHVCHGVSGALYMVAFGIQEKTNKEIMFDDKPGDSLLIIPMYNSDTELLTRTFIILVKDAIKRYPNTIDYRIEMI